MVFSRSRAWGSAVALLVLVGFSNTFYLTQVSTFLQEHVPDRLRGRVLSLYSLCWNLLPMGGLLAGVLAAAVDARFAVLFGGVMVPRTRCSCSRPGACARSRSRRLKKAQLFRWRPRPPCLVGGELIAPTIVVCGGPDMAPALPHREYASRATFGRRLAAGPL